MNNLDRDLEKHFRILVGLAILCLIFGVWGLFNGDPVAPFSIFFSVAGTGLAWLGKRGWHRRPRP
jgi:hypothetical protein